MDVQVSTFVYGLTYGPLVGKLVGCDEGAILTVSSSKPEPPEGMYGGLVTATFLGSGGRIVVPMALPS
jgi:hypothetical protein